MQATRPNTVIQQSSKEYPDFADYLVELGFHRCVLGTASAKFKSKYSLLGQALPASIRLLLRLGQNREMGIVVAFGHFAFVIKLLGRLHLVRYDRLFCFAFFVHSPAWFKIFRLLVRLDTAKDHYLIFSRSEMELYGSKLGIARGRMHYVPYGDWSNTPLQASLPRDLEAWAGTYYFSGGYSDRDYLCLINVFRKLAVHLVIVCSSLNRELDNLSLPPNVRILRDLPSDQFEACIQHAKAGIIPLKRDTGAAGQSVLIRLMRQAKTVIASDAGAMRDYVNHGESGFLLCNLHHGLPDLISTFEANPEKLSSMGKAAYEKYINCFSRAVVSELTKKILFSDSPKAT